MNIEFVHDTCPHLERLLVNMCDGYLDGIVEICIGCATNIYPRWPFPVRRTYLKCRNCPRRLAMFHYHNPFFRTAVFNEVQRRSTKRQMINLYRKYLKKELQRNATT